MINASVMQIVKESDTIKLIRWYNEIDKSGEIIIDDEMFLTGLINAMKEKDEFEVIAINASGNAVGKEKPKDILKEYSYAGINNRFVGPFSTIE